MEMLYNPDVMSTAEFKATFVGREDVLQELMDLVRSQPPGAGVQHAIVIAPRGMGKTSVLQRLYLAVLDSDLGTVWLPLKYPEELYGVVDVADFWLETLLLLAVATSDPALAAQTRTLPGRFPQRGDLAGAAFALLKDVRQRLGKRFLLLVENLDQLFATFADEEDNARVREVLMNDGTLMLVGSAVKYFKQARGYDQPLYNFFRTFHLESLTFEQTQALLLRRAAEDRIPHFAETLQANTTRQRVLYHFTQGIPRLVLMLYRVLMESDVAGVRQALEKLLDEVTPYYKARIEVLPSQLRKLVEYVARAAARTHEGVSPTVLAADVHLPVNQVNMQLKRLVQAGYLRSVPLRGRTACYVLSEPLYALWHQMRLNPETRSRKLGWLVDLLYQWYDDGERVAEAERLFTRYQEYERHNDGVSAMAIVEYAQLLAQSALTTEVAGQVLRQTARIVIRARDKRFDSADSAEALTELRSAVETSLVRNPDDVDSLVAKGNLLVWIDTEYAAALDCFDKALAIKPDDVGAWRMKGTACYFLGRYEEALGAEQSGLEIDPNDPGLWNNYGLSLGKLERYMEAHGAYSKALALDPGNALAASNQASVLSPVEDQFLEAVHDNHLDIARQVWDTLCHISPDDGLLRIRKRCVIFAAQRGLWAFTRELIAAANVGEELFPLDRAVAYLQTNDETLLEKLSPEMKNIVQVFVDDLRQTEAAPAQPGKHWLATTRIWEFDDYASKRVHKILGKDSASQRDSWWIVLVFPHVQQEFARIISHGNLTLTDYGLILASGFGKKPGDAVLQKYGFRV